MYRLAYAEAASEGWQENRQLERQAFLKSIELMERAEMAGMKSSEAIDAAVFVTRLWCHLIEDLGRDDNHLALELRARLISIGLFLIRVADDVKSGKQESFRPMIEITASIAEGLKA